MNHSQAQARIAWYVNDTLASDEREQLSEHALTCSACREGIAASELLREAVVEVADDEPVFDVSMVHSLAQRLPEQERAISVSLESSQEDQVEPAAGRVVSFGERLRKVLPGVGQWQHTPAPMRWAMAAQVALIVGMAFLIGAPGSDSGEPVFETVAGPTTIADANVVWRDDAAIEQINALLEAIGAEVSAGPNGLGMYRLSFSGDVAPAERIATLRGSELVLYAELVVQ
ncbi:MAG: zf-HC2 domain-containing protein [Pseudomonadaceae bacterium]|nr:zf-HC2 domain-containing protein [Pseudomonadaceae bacterium]